MSDRTYTPEQADLIRSLDHHPGWQLYRKILKRARIDALNASMDVTKREERGNYDLGVHDGLMRAWTIPEWVVADSIENLDQRMGAMPSELLGEEDLV